MRNIKKTSRAALQNIQKGVSERTSKLAIKRSFVFLHKNKKVFRGGDNSRIANRAIGESSIMNTTIKNVAFENVTFEKVNFESVRFVDTQFVGCEFLNCSFSQIRFQGGKIDTCSLSGFSSKETKWEKVTLTDTVVNGVIDTNTFVDCQLTNLVADYTTFKDVEMRKTFVSGGHWNQTNFSGAHVDSCTFKNVEMKEMFLQKFPVVKLSLFTNVCFNEAHIFALTMIDSHLENCEIKNAFVDTQFLSTVSYGHQGKIVDSQFDNTVFSSLHVMDSIIQDCNFRGATFQNHKFHANTTHGNVFEGSNIDVDTQDI